MRDETREMRRELIDYAESKPGWEVTETRADEDEDYDDNKVLSVELVVERVLEEDGENEYKHDDEEAFR